MISTTTRGALLDLIFLATTWANYAINATSSPEANIVFSLQTADPGAGGTMATSEASYTSYARQNVARTGAGFTRTGNSISPDANIEFPVGSGGSGTITHFTCGKSGGGAAAYLFSGTVTPNIASGTGVQPILLTTTAITLV